jgi:4-amino-4-deoxy-L-arabinose transferase-like glycosyltransferase
MTRPVLSSLFLFLALVAGTLWPSVGYPQENILRNGSLTDGKTSPDHWSTSAWQAGPGYSTFSWDSSRREVEISSVTPNDASWIQKVHLAPGWYHFTASMRTENVPSGKTGAYISILEDGIVSDFLYGTSDWRELGFYLKAGPAGADVVFGCRLGGYSSLNIGKAFCRDLSAVKVAAPPANAIHKYELDVIHAGGVPPSTPGTANTALIAVIFATAIAALVGLLIGRKRVGKSSQKSRNSQFPSAGEIRVPEPVRRVEIVLFLVSIVTYAYFYQAADHSTGARFDLVRAILERHTLWIEGYAGFNTADIIQLRSHVYSNKAPGGSFTGILPWLLTTGFLRLFISQPSAMYWALATYLTNLLSVSLISAVTIVIVYRSALRLGASHGRAVAVALTLAFATIFFPYATEFTAEPIAAACVLAAFYILARTDMKETRWPALASGLLAGWAVLCDYPTFLLSSIVALYALWRLHSIRQLLPFVLGALSVAVLLAIYNYLAFHNVFFLSYEAYKLSGNRNWFPEQAVGFAGVTYPRARILWDVLFSPQRGLFFCNPVLVLAIPGLVYFWRKPWKRADFMVIGGSIVVFILFNGSYGQSIIYWGGGTATGPRHMLSMVPLMTLALVFLPDGFNPAFAAMALVSAFLMLMATAVEPHLPYEYAHPFRDFIWPAYLRGDLAYNKSSYFGGSAIAGDSVAFNLGKLAGLPGPLQLLPLAAIWGGAGLYILDALRLHVPSANARERLNGKVCLAFVAIALLFVPPIAGTFVRQPAGDHGLLGRYYEGSRPGVFPPHIQRVDREINFDNITNLGALPPPSVVVWTGKLMAPVAGLYNFTITVDDSGWLKIDNRNVIADPGEISKMRDSGSVYLSAGEHNVEVGERNIWGDSSMHLFWQPPGGGQEIVPPKYLKP